MPWWLQALAPWVGSARSAEGAVTGEGSYKVDEVPAEKCPEKRF